MVTNNDIVPFNEAKLKVPLESSSWPVDRAERVGVNSYGIGGANAHVREVYERLHTSLTVNN